MTSTPARRFVLLVLAYLGPLALIPLVWTWRHRAEADGDGDVQWHARQGVLLAIVEGLVLGLLTAATGLTALSNLGAGVTLGLFTWLVWVAVLALQLAAMVSALAGHRLALPVVSQLASR